MSQASEGLGPDPGVASRCSGVLYFGPWQIELLLEAPEDADEYGCMDPFHLQVQVDPGLKPEALLATILHELWHFVREYSWGEPQDEVEVCRLTEATLLLIKQNPWLFREILRVFARLTL
jgi:hypothetical protein